MNDTKGYVRKCVKTKELAQTLNQQGTRGMRVIVATLNRFLEIFQPTTTKIG